MSTEMSVRRVESESREVLIAEMTILRNDQCVKKAGRSVNGA